MAANGNPMTMKSLIEVHKQRKLHLVKKETNSLHYLLPFAT